MILEAFGELPHNKAKTPSEVGFTHTWHGWFTSIAI